MTETTVGGGGGRRDVAGAFLSRQGASGAAAAGPGAVGPGPFCSAWRRDEAICTGVPGRRAVRMPAWLACRGICRIVSPAAVRLFPGWFSVVAPVRGIFYRMMMISSSLASSYHLPLRYTYL